MKEKGERRRLGLTVEKWKYGGGNGGRSQRDSAQNQENILRKPVWRFMSRVLMVSL
ncbi:MAG: hypothetical protein PHT98_13195 [Kiritimatiellae bacterium]|jgi:hypothetical protein|nr:hypothetical protein [Kiritimatiellia bacterium]MDX9795158.1 hypothetical protein [Kiritimatiellia bacterium]